MELLAVGFVYGGAAAAILGLFSHPLWWIGSGVVLIAVGFLLPPREVRVEVLTTLHDRFAPVYQFNEIHEIEIRAGRDKVYDAIQKTTAGEILFFRTLTWIRRFGRPAPESILNAPAGRPLLELATHTGFLLLDEKPGREIVIGTLLPHPGRFEGIRSTGRFAAFQRPGYAKATLNFMVEDIRPNLSRVRTETRVYAPDTRTQYRFAAYWRMIYPASALIRRMWLRAIRLRAER